MATENGRELEAELWVDQPDGFYKSGENIIVYARVNKAAFLKLFYLNAAGEIIQILPNQYASNCYIESNNTRSFGDDQDPFKFLVVPPFGIEALIAFASTNQLSEISNRDLPNGLHLVQETAQDMVQKLRGVEVEIAISFLAKLQNW